MTGIDNEYLPCGGICLARTAGEKAALAGQSGLWEEQGVRFRELSIEQLLEREPALNGDRIPDKTRAVEVPDESQVRNPRHLSALTTACRILGVELCEFSPVRKIQPAEDQVNVRLDDHVVSAKQVCITCGAWTTPLVKEFSRVQVVPIKGHILLFKLDQPPFQRIINEANRYVVCRKDGHVLVGSSEEETGWDDSANPAELDRLRQFAQSICVQLNEKTYVRAWTGLRPMAFDQVPYVGRHSVHTNVWFATGHYRAGLQLSTGTADLVSRMILGQNLPFDPNELRPER